MSIFRAFDSTGFVAETRAREKALYADIVNNYHQYGPLAPAMDLARITQAAAEGAPLMSDILETQAATKMDHHISSTWRDKRLQVERQAKKNQQSPPSPPSSKEISAQPSKSTPSNNAPIWIVGGGVLAIIVAVAVVVALNNTPH